MTTQSKQKLKETITGGFHFILGFLKNPISVMKNLPSIPISEAITVQFSLAMATGFLMGLMAKSLFTIVWSIIFYPILSIVTCAITSLLLYYGLSYFTKKSFMYSNVYVLVFLASIPAYFIRILHPLLASIDLLGLAISSVLLRVGLIYSHKVDRQIATKLVVILYAILFLGFAISWLEQIQISDNFGF